MVPVLQPDLQVIDADRGQCSQHRREGGQERGHGLLISRAMAARSKTLSRRGGWWRAQDVYPVVNAGTSRATRRPQRLETDELREPVRRSLIAALNRALCDILCGCPTGVPPSGVVTFLFTDVEGSTRRWESDADAMRAALAAHDEVLRAAIEAHGGFLFNHTGDGVVAAFASPRSAVDAAVAAQRALELPVRMGVATGEAELRDGDYFGTVLNRAARVMAAGHGGQILVAESTAVLLSGVDLLDLGPRRLRDVPTPVGVFQVRAPGLRTEFPPLRALDPNPESAACDH